MKKALVRENFLDSGAFSVFFKRVKHFAKITGKSVWEYYDTHEFEMYLQRYVRFVKKYASAIDRYATIDAIGNPELTWKIQQRLENEFGLKPVPVVHFGASLDWIDHYVQRGYPLIGLGGMAKSVHGDQKAVRRWLDMVFDAVCSTPSRKPHTKMHGFGFTSWRMIVRYPWYSVDSSVWTQAAGYGNIYIPRKVGSRFDYTKPPIAIKVTEDCKARSKHGQHILTLRKAETKVLMSWLEEIDVPFGNVIPWVEGVSNSVAMRRKANVIYFQRLAAAQPEYPWPFPEVSHRNSFGYDLGRKK